MKYTNTTSIYLSTYLKCFLQWYVYTFEGLILTTIEIFAHLRIVKIEIWTIWSLKDEFTQFLLNKILKVFHDI